VIPRRIIYLYLSLYIYIYRYIKTWPCEHGPVKKTGVRGGSSGQLSK
jgi:hypothetical protein